MNKISKRFLTLALSVCLAATPALPMTATVASATEIVTPEETTDPTDTTPSEETTTPTDTNSSEETTTPTDTTPSEETTTPSEETSKPTEVTPSEETTTPTKPTTTTTTTTVTVSTPKIKSVTCESSGMLIKWGKVSNATSYEVYRKNAKGDFVKIKTTSSLSYKDTAAKTNGSSYNYRVKAVRKKDGKTYRSKYSATKKGIYLTKAKLDVVTCKSGKATVTWKANTKATGYQIQYATKKNYSNGKTVNVSGGSKTKKTISVSATTNYYIRVRAVKKSGDVTYYGPWSENVKLIGWHKSWTYASKSAIHSDSVTLYYSTVSASKRKNITVAINAGHGCKGGERKRTLCHPDGSAKVTGGSTGSGATKATAIATGTNMKDGTSEADVNLAIAKQLKKELLAQGYDVLMIRENSDTQLDNIARTVIANKNADMHIAIHFDSTSSNKGAFYCSVPTSKKYRSMAPVKSHYKQHEALGKALIAGLKSKNVKIYSSGAIAIDLTQTSYSTIPSVDIEIGDRATSHTASAISKYAKGLAAGIAKMKL